MNAEQLIQLSQVYSENRDFITNEETAKMSLVVPFIRLLGYDPNIPREVRLEYSAQFTQGDGKRLPDKMDFAIFDKIGTKPLIVIETKPLGTNLRAKSHQLARYIAQLPDLHFGIMTDGCMFQFYGDLESPNVMDSEPFFTFSLDDPRTDWTKVASFLSKFSREAFNAETLLTDAENSRYRQAIVDKLVRVLRAPAEDDAFMRWLTMDIYAGKKTGQVMVRMGELAREAVEPSLLRVMGDEFVEKLKERIQAAREPETELSDRLSTEVGTAVLFDESLSLKEQDGTRKEVVTTEEELAFYEIVKDICNKAGYEVSRILIRDTVNYCNVSFDKPTKWFVRFFGDARRKNIVTLVPTGEVRGIVEGFEIEDAPSTFGVSRIFIDEVDQMRTIEAVVIRSLEILLNESAKGG